MTTSGTLNTLWQRDFTSSTKDVFLFDLFYDSNNDQMIAAFNGYEYEYRIVWIKDFGKASGITVNQINFNDGQPFSLVVESA